MLLALLCIGTAELAASYFYAPEFFDRVTTPVIRTVKTCADFVGDTYRETKDAVSTACLKAKEDLQALAAQLQRPEDPPAQLAEGSLYTSDTPIADPAVTELRSDGRREYLTGGIMDLRVMAFREDMAKMLADRFRKAPEKIYGEIMNVLLSDGQDYKSEK